MTMTRTKATRALIAVCDAIVEAIKAAGDDGAPGGVLYAALMTHGMTLSQFEYVMNALVRAKRVTRRGQLYFAS
jgi:hypothetical protein